jgi:hypothetical protein
MEHRKDLCEDSLGFGDAHAKCNLVRNEAVRDRNTACEYDSQVCRDSEHIHGPVNRNGVAFLEP